MKVGGRDFNLTMQEVEARMKGEEAELIQKHMVEVNGQLFPPKQVLGHVTGWPRASFTTMEAQRVLSRIGFDCSQLTGGPRRRAGEFALGAVRESIQGDRRNHGDLRFLKGFSVAAGLALQPIETRLDSLREEMKSTGLSVPEQAVYAHLEEIRAEIEAACDDFWQSTGVDWRPLKPIVSGAIRVAEDPEQ
ncbi:MAG: hypothetical protein KDA98_03805 [Acidimicrobiales bacterium]|nr:hypothetical protein [Acidimicrobiales bacterium]